MLNIKLNLEHSSYDEAITNLVNNLSKEFEQDKATSIAYKMPQSLENCNKEIVDAFNECEMQLLVKAFKELINENKSEFRAGDLWILEDAVDIEDKIVQDTYARLESL